MLPTMNREALLDDFLGRLEFELYPFQEEALLAWFECAGGVLVTAPTGMGKTLVAEAAIFEALSTGERMFYTTPLIALTDQKFQEFQDKAEAWGFPREQVGLITGNRKINPGATVRVVVAEILLNHLLAEDVQLGETRAVVMDEFHYFNDRDRGVVWELSLMLLPSHIRLMLLSATVGNPVEFVGWLSKEHNRTLKLVQTEQRRVPLAFDWVGDKLLTEQLPTMVSDDDVENRSPALVFCFNRDQCWAVAERLKGLKLVGESVRKQIEERLDSSLFQQGIGPKLRQMLIRGVGVHHAGVLPKYKSSVESLFLDKLIPLVVCTETLAAGVNLPARSVVVSTLLKGKKGDKKLIAPSSAHQMFGRAGRPQFDTNGYVYAMAHEDDIKITKWRKRYDQIDPNSKDPGIMRMRKQLERKRPSRRKTQQYWVEGQFRNLIEARPAKLASRSMIPYQALIYLLTTTGSLTKVKSFLSKRFNTAERLAKFQDQLDHMIGNLAAMGYLDRPEDSDDVTLKDHISDLLNFRSIDPLYGVYVCQQLSRGDFDEKLQTLESVLSMPPAIEKKTSPPEFEPGPMQTQVLLPAMIKAGLVIAGPDGSIKRVGNDDDEGADYMVDDDVNEQPLLVPEMLDMLFQDRLATPDPVFVQPKWVLGGIVDLESDFYKYVRSRDLQKNEGLVLRHLLRLTIVAGEFLNQSAGDPDYQRMIDQASLVCRSVDERYTERFLESEQKARALGPV